MRRSQPILHSPAIIFTQKVVCWVQSLPHRCPPLVLWRLGVEGAPLLFALFFFPVSRSLTDNLAPFLTILLRNSVRLKSWFDHILVYSFHKNIELATGQCWLCRHLNEWGQSCWQRVVASSSVGFLRCRDSGCARLRAWKGVLIR